MPPRSLGGMALAEVEWRKLRADQLRALAEQDAIVLLPVGSMEQHGPHLPVEVDSALGEAVAIRIAQETAARGQPTVALPPVWTGLSEHHMSFGGTITIELATMVALIGDICRSLVRHGFRRLALLNSHGGNENALRSIADDLSPKLGVAIVEFCYWHAAAEPIAAILETQRALLHACEAETSMMLAVRPGGAAMDRVALCNAPPSTELEDVVGPGMYRWRALGSRTSSGVIGNPAAASAEKGARLLAGIAEDIAGKLANPRLWNLPWKGPERS